MSNVRRSLLLVLTSVLTSPFWTPSTANAQDQGWQSQYNNSCTAVRTTLAENMRQIVTLGTGRVSIAHRGAYSQPLPGTDKYPAENTILAMQYAQCQGFAGVEVDLKVTSDRVLILGHDANLMRFTNDDYNGGTFNPETGAQIRNESQQTTRDFSGNQSPVISALPWSSISSAVKFAKTYTNEGKKVQDAAIANSNSMRLEDVLQQAKTDPTMSNLVWVLDIQSHDQYQLAHNIVSRNNLWDRVIFKMWMNAVPMYVSPERDFEVHGDDLPGQGHFVFAIGAANSRMEGGNLQTQYWNFNGTEAEWGNTNELIDAVGRWIKNICNNASCFANGFELFTSGARDDEDIQIAALQPRISFYNPGGREWGVIRIADFLRKNCESSPDGCTKFPNGEYFGNAPTDGPTQSYVRFYSLPSADLVRRRTYAESRQVETEDVRYPTVKLRSINSPNERTNFFASTSMLTLN